MHSFEDPVREFISSPEFAPFFRDGKIIVYKLYAFISRIGVHPKEDPSILATPFSYKAYSGIESGDIDTSSVDEEPLMDTVSKENGMEMDLEASMDDLNAEKYSNEEDEEEDLSHQWKIDGVSFLKALRRKYGTGTRVITNRVFGILDTLKKKYNNDPLSMVTSPSYSPYFSSTTRPTQRALSDFRSTVEKTRKKRLPNNESRKKPSSSSSSNSEQPRKRSRREEDSLASSLSDPPPNSLEHPSLWNRNLGNTQHVLTGEELSQVFDTPESESASGHENGWEMGDFEGMDHMPDLSTFIDDLENDLSDKCI